MEEVNKETNVEETQDIEAQKIIDKIEGKEEPINDGVELPSDNKDEENKLYANKYTSVDELRKGIIGIGSELPQYIIDGMSDEALEQHYAELNKEFSSKSKEEKTDRKHSVDKEEEKKEEVPNKAISKELWNDITSQFNEKGGISDDMYDKLEEVGIPSNIVDNYIDGLTSKQETFTKSIYDIAGGEQEYNTIKAWAEETLDANYISAISSMDQSGMIGAMQGIKAQYDAANGKQVSNRLVGNQGNSNSGSGYKDMAEYLADVADPMYHKNAKFAAKVDKKLSSSKF